MSICPTTAETLLQKTAPGSVDRLLMRLQIESDGDMRLAFERLVAEHPPEEFLWLVFSWLLAEGISPDELKASADAPVRLGSAGALSHPLEQPDQGVTIP